jgi:hypothetical protein
MPVLAICSDCGNEHPLGERTARIGGEPETCSSTACPSCDSPSYRSQPTDLDFEAEAERIHDRIDDVAGVGDKNGDAIVERFRTLDRLEQATLSELTEVRGVGRTTAENVLEKIDR